MGNWILVTERLPSDDNTVLVAVPGLEDETCLGFYRASIKCWTIQPFFETTYTTKTGVTHWMPLPELPAPGDGSKES